MSEFTSRASFCLFGSQPLAHEMIRALGEVMPKLLAHVAFDIGALYQPAI
jgi:hypothetical protein